MMPLTKDAKMAHTFPTLRTCPQNPNKHGLRYAIYSMTSWVLLAIMHVTPSAAQTSEYRGQDGIYQYVSCDRYADRTITQARMARALRCPGINGGRWTTDRQAHIGWCESISNNNDTLASEDEARMRVIDQCRANHVDVSGQEKQQSCAEYADNAVQQMSRFKQWCGQPEGGRWTSDRQAHINWCVDNDLGASASEREQREQELASCEPVGKERQAKQQAAQEEADRQNSIPQAVISLISADERGKAINIERTKQPEVGSFDAGWDSAKWVIKMVPGSDRRMKLENRWTGCYLAVKWKPEQLPSDDDDIQVDDWSVDFDTHCTTTPKLISEFEFWQNGNSVHVMRKGKSCRLTLRPNGRLTCQAAGFWTGSTNWLIRNVKQDGNQGPYRVSDTVAAFIPN
jgi:hypothetical protein